jgi:hypothetical protein
VIKIFAEQRAGELLKEMPREQGKRTDRTSGHSVAKLADSPSFQSALQDLGIEKKTGERWQLEAEIPPECVEKYKSTKRVFK